jgi:hypothetical protein
MRRVNSNCKKSLRKRGNISIEGRTTISDARHLLFFLIDLIKLVGGVGMGRQKFRRSKYRFTYLLIVEILGPNNYTGIMNLHIKRPRMIAY